MSVAAKRLGVGRDAVIRYIEAGILRGFRMQDRGWWKVSKASIEEVERRIQEQMAQT